MKTLLFPEPAIIPTESYSGEIIECPNCKVGSAHIPSLKDRTYSMGRLIGKSIELDQRAMESLATMELWVGVSDLVTGAESKGLLGVKLEDVQYEVIVQAVESKWRPIMLRPLLSLFDAVRAAGTTDGTEEIPVTDPPDEVPVTEEVETPVPVEHPPIVAIDVVTAAPPDAV